MFEFFGELSPALLLAMIAGIVEFFKNFGVTGKWSLLLSLGLGIVLAAVFQLQAMFPAVAPWSTLVLYSVLFGMTASGYYDLAKRFFAQK